MVCHIGRYAITRGEVVKSAVRMLPLYTCFNGIGI